MVQDLRTIRQAAYDVGDVVRVLHAHWTIICDLQQPECIYRWRKLPWY